MIIGHRCWMLFCHWWIKPSWGCPGSFPTATILRSLGEAINGKVNPGLPWHAKIYHHINRRCCWIVLNPCQSLYLSICGALLNTCIIPPLREEATGSCVSWLSMALTQIWCHLSFAMVAEDVGQRTRGLNPKRSSYFLEMVALSSKKSNLYPQLYIMNQFVQIIIMDGFESEFTKILIGLWIYFE